MVIMNNANIVDFSKSGFKGPVEKVAYCAGEKRLGFRRDSPCGCPI